LNETLPADVFGIIFLVNQIPSIILVSIYLNSGRSEMASERREHLENIAAQLTQAYYQSRQPETHEHRDILETYFFLLGALRDRDGQPEGTNPLQPGDTMAPFSKK